MNCYWCSNKIEGPNCISYSHPTGTEILITKLVEMPLSEVLEGIPALCSDTCKKELLEERGVPFQDSKHYKMLCESREILRKINWKLRLKKPGFDPSLY